MRAERQLIEFFLDPDLNVQRHAAHVFRNINPAEFHYWRRLADPFVHAPAFDCESWSFFHFLEKTSGNTSELTIAAAARVIADLDQYGTAGGRRVSELHTLQGLIRQDYAATEGNEPLRGQLLDIIDAMLARQL